jgi:hypothetical protein
MTDEDYKLIDSWIEASGKRAVDSGFQEVYREGWLGGIIDIQARMDDYRKAQKRDKIAS